MFNIDETLLDDIRDKLREFKASINGRLDGFQSSLNSKVMLSEESNRRNKRLDEIVPEFLKSVSITHTRLDRQDEKLNSMIFKMSDIHRNKVRKSRG